MNRFSKQVNKFFFVTFSTLLQLLFKTVDFEVIQILQTKLEFYAQSTNYSNKTRQFFLR